MPLVQIRLGDADRARYEGLPEWLPFDLARPMLSQVRLLRQQVNMSWPELRAGMEAKDLEAIGAVFWLAVRTAGHSVPWDDFEVDLVAAESRSPGGDDDPNSSAPDGAKPTSTTSRRTSRSSSASTRGTSKGSRSRSSTAT